MIDMIWSIYLSISLYDIVHTLWTGNIMIGKCEYPCGKPCDYFLLPMWLVTTGYRHGLSRTVEVFRSRL